jgi:hypothetical protein
MVLSAQLGQALEKNAQKRRFISLLSSPSPSPHTLNPLSLTLLLQEYLYSAMPKRTKQNSLFSTCAGRLRSRKAVNRHESCRTATLGFDSTLRNLHQNWQLSQQTLGTDFVPRRMCMTTCVSCNRGDYNNHGRLRTRNVD